MKANRQKSVIITDGIRLSGYEGEYIFEKIATSKRFYEQPLLEKWFFGTNSSVVYDIGANIGNHTVYFAKSSPKAQIFAFEPMPDNFTMLEKNIRDNNFNNRVKPYPMAVGETEGTVCMGIMQEGNHGTATILEDDADVGMDVHIANIISIDNLNLPLPNFIKIDVEGYELSVLKGMKNTIKNAKELIIWIEVDEKTATQVYDFMDSLGFAVMDFALEQNSNVLWCNQKTMKLQTSNIFRNLLAQSEISRQRFWDAQNAKSIPSKLVYEQKKANDLAGQLKSMASKYEYEQEKADDLATRLGSMTSKFTHEQKKADDLLEQLKSMVSKYEYEQGKANALTEQLKSMVSKYEYEQGKASNLAEQFKSMVSKYEYERRKANSLAEQLKSTVSKYEHEQGKANDLTTRLGSMTSKFTYEQKKADDLLEQLKSMVSKFTYEQNKASELTGKLQVMQEELNMFRNSKMISFFRFWIWHMPTATRRKIRLRINKFGSWSYVKLLPHPKARTFLSKANGKLKIYKNPQEIVATYPQIQPQQPNYQSPDPNAGITSETNKIKTDDDKSKLPREMNVAMISDEFTFNSFRYECNVLSLEPNNWQEIFDQNDIDLFFCESAWAGVDSLQRPWRGKIYASKNFPKENRGTLLEILDYCRKNHIPTVFWNKEDPAHYEDRIHDFVKTALEFDHIFTTSEECIERYEKEYGHKSVHLLMFATQPKLFNPIETFERTEEIIFAGSWYAQHPVRCSEMSNIFDATLQSSHTLKIYNRHSENDDPNHAFPDKYLSYIHSRLPHDQLDVAYKGSKYALNFNTVTKSDTMFARRALELMSSNTLVISNYSKGLEQLFGDNIVFTDGTTPLALSDIEKKREQCLYAVLNHHTYRHRFEQILDDIALPYLHTVPLVALYYNVSSVEDASIATKHFHSMDWDNKQCVLILNKDCSPAELQGVVCNFNLGAVTVRSAHYDATYQSDSKKKVSTSYLIEATTQLSRDFIKKALAHSCYLEKTTAIVSGSRKYSFSKTREKTNVLIPSECVDSSEFTTYII